MTILNKAYKKKTTKFTKYDIIKIGEKIKIKFSETVDFSLYEQHILYQLIISDRKLEQLNI
jgi:hypothetical protein